MTEGRDEGTGELAAALASTQRPPLRLAVFELVSLQRCFTRSLDVPPHRWGSVVLCPVYLPTKPLPQLRITGCPKCRSEYQFLQVSIKPAPPFCLKVNRKTSLPLYLDSDHSKQSLQNPLSVSIPSHIGKGGKVTQEIHDHLLLGKFYQVICGTAHSSI